MLSFAGTGTSFAKPLRPAKPATSTAATRSAVNTAETKVMAIKAAKDNAKGGKISIAPALKPLAGKLEKVFPGYDSFSLEKTHNLALQMGSGDTVSLPNGDMLKITYKGLDKNMLNLLLEIPGKLKTSVSVKDGGTFFQAGLEYEKGILILAISPQAK